jgi:phosphatidylserine/phosphatidylglycerophosphate/cardiolipin synthase-like enzyme
MARYDATVISSLRKRTSLVVIVVAAILASTGAAGATRPDSVPTQSALKGASDLSVIVEPSRLGSASGMQPIYSFVLSAKKSLDMTMYELADATMESDLIEDAHRGVRVRVILDSNRERSRNTAAFDTLKAGGVKVVWADPSYEATHQKTISVDDDRSLILSGNLTAEYYTTTRDFGIFDSNPTDVEAIEAVFAADFDHKPITPVNGTDLVWSPGSEPQMLAVIDGARHTLSIENEEMDDSAITSAIAAAAARGVNVEVTMTADTYDASLDEIVKAGGHVHLYADYSSDLYIHAKTTIADAGRSDEKLYVGSVNFSSASMEYNRELGIITTNAAVIADLNSVVTGDYTNCTAATDCRSYA